MFFKQQNCPLNLTVPQGGGGGGINMCAIDLVIIITK